MAALYLHNALFAPESPSREPHIRNQSAVSTVTLQTSASHPNEPLLQPATPESTAFWSPGQLVHSDGSHPESDSVYDADHSSLNSPREERRVQTGRRSKMLLLWQRVLLGIISAWALYNSVRYFLSFVDFVSRERQLFALLLGASTTLSLALVLASLVLNLGWPPVSNTPQNIRRLLLPYLASWFLLAPAIVNFVLVFVWKHSPDSQMTLRDRCSWDIDVVWSGIGMECNPPGSSPSWPAWLIGAIFRLLFTGGILAAYHTISHVHHSLLRKPSRSVQESPYTRFPSHRRHHHRDSSIANIPARVSRPTQDYTPVSSTISALPTVHRHQYHRNLSGDVTLETETSSRSTHTAHEQAPAGPNFKITPSGSSANSPAIIPNELPSGPSLSSSEDTMSTESDRSYHYPPGGTGLGPGYASTSESEFNSFSQRFHAMIDQIEKETDVGVRIARPDSRMNRYSGSTDSTGADDDDEYPPYPQPYADSGEWYFDEYGQAQPVLYDDDRVEVFGRPVHRMPTIESLGSREALTSLAPSRSLNGIERAMSGSSASSPTDVDGRTGTPTSWGQRGVRVNEVGELMLVPMRQPLDMTGRSGGTSVSAGSRSTTGNTFHSAMDSPGVDF